MKITKPLLVAMSLSLSLLLSACFYPQSKVEQGNEQAALFFPGAREDAMVYVDGEAAGSAISYDGVEHVLAVSTGRHIVELRRGDTVLLRKDLFVGEGSRIEVTAN